MHLALSMVNSCLPGIYANDHIPSFATEIFFCFLFFFRFFFLDVFGDVLNRIEDSNLLNENLNMASCDHSVVA